jgi:hypothetical protein
MQPKDYCQSQDLLFAPQAKAAHQRPWEQRRPSAVRVRTQADLEQPEAQQPLELQPVVQQPLELQPMVQQLLEPLGLQPVLELQPVVLQEVLRLGRQLVQLAQPLPLEPDAMLPHHRMSQLPLYSHGLRRQRCDEEPSW